MICLCNNRVLILTAVPGCGSALKTTHCAIFEDILTDSNLSHITYLWFGGGFNALRVS